MERDELAAVGALVRLRGHCVTMGDVFRVTSGKAMGVTALVDVVERGAIACLAHRLELLPEVAATFVVACFRLQVAAALSRGTLAIAHT